LNYLFPGAVLRQIYLFSYRYALRQYDRILVLTPSDVQGYLHAYPSCRRKVVVLPNAVEIDEQCTSVHESAKQPLRQELGLSAETRLVMMVARLDPQKDWITFLETARLVQEQMDQCCGFLVVGSGPEEQRLQDYAAAVSIGPVFFLNHRGDVPSLLHQVDVFLLTSRREPFGIVVLEAMAAGCPVVATRSGGPDSILTDGVDGLLADVGDVKGLTNHIISLLKDDGFARKLVQAARRTVADLYNLEAVSTRMADIYREVLKQ
jgi:glycosyltransferase involved in cell wall biosynthesis